MGYSDSSSEVVSQKNIALSSKNVKSFLLLGSVGIG